MVVLFHSVTKVLIAWRCVGGVAIIDKSRKPDSDIFKVRGIGVAVMVSISTLARSFFICSLSRTPKRCSSSIITSPRFLNSTSSCNSLCVPITISMLPAAKASKVLLLSLPVLKRDNDSMRNGQSAKRSRKLFKCCCTNKVVGATIATCLPALAATKAARMATSVLPNPTSPQTTRSIGCLERISFMTFSIAKAWSGVSSNGKAPANKR